MVKTGKSSSPAGLSTPIKAAASSNTGKLGGKEAWSILKEIAVTALLDADSQESKQPTSTIPMKMGSDTMLRLWCLTATIKPNGCKELSLLRYQRAIIAKHRNIKKIIIFQDQMIARRMKIVYNSTRVRHAVDAEVTLPPILANSMMPIYFSVGLDEDPARTIKEAVRLEEQRQQLHTLLPGCSDDSNNFSSSIRIAGKRTRGR